MKKINIEEILDRRIDWGIFSSRNPETANRIEEAMLEFGKQLLELAAENADVEEIYRGKSYRIDSAFYDNDDSKVIVHKQSILDTIKQVE